MTSITQRLGYPNLGMGLGLRSKHFNYLMKNDPIVDWFEIISENFIDNYGYARKVLSKLREQVPIVMHGVSLSIGSTAPLNQDYLRKLKELAEWIQPAWISDHLCWTGINHRNTHDLLPMPLTTESLDHVCQRIEQVQAYLGRPLILENPSTYLEFSDNSLTEWEYLSLMSQRTGCGLLLDVNNVFVSSVNHGFDPVEYIKGIPAEKVVQIHLAGPTNFGGLLIDTHDQAVPTEVWKLYQLAQQRTGGVATLLEWDAKIPEYEELVAELHKAKSVLEGVIPQVDVYREEREQVSNPVGFQVQLAHE